ncbi:MAG: hypothetical protein Tsb0026_01220 [Sulfuricaulis sp.]
MGLFQNNTRRSGVVPGLTASALLTYLMRSPAMRRRLRRAVMQLESGKGKARRLIKR